VLYTVESELTVAGNGAAALLWLRVAYGLPWLVLLSRLSSREASLFVGSNAGSNGGLGGEVHHLRPWRGRRTWGSRRPDLRKEAGCAL
jgi:hypothetical protein